MIRTLFKFWLIITSIGHLAAQTGLPSCVITAPHVNAYFQAGKAMTIRVYATDIGGTAGNGTITKVEFYDGTTLLGDATTHTNNTFVYVWNNLPSGTHTIKAKATDNSGNVSTSSGVIVTIGTNAVTARGLSACKGKYLANIVASNTPQNWLNYWNGVTAENSCKWGSVEGTRDQMSWGGADVVYNLAKNNNLMFRYHAIAWGSQYPNWITSLSTTDFKAEMIEYMDAIAAKYPLIDQIDVLNEQLGSHAGGTGYFRDGLGGNGSTGYDWQIWLFTEARKRFPNAKLVLNDYGLENDQNAIKQMLELVKRLRDRNLIDGFGTQAHEFNINTLTATQMKSSLDLMATSGVPIYVTELDISGDDNTQANRYKTLFPVYWEHPAVGGITLWGYIDGQTWKTDTGLVSSGNNNPTESPAMQYIKQYMTARTNVGYPFCTQESTITSLDDAATLQGLQVYPNPFEESIYISLSGSFSYQLMEVSGRVLQNGNGNNELILGTDLATGMYLLKVSKEGESHSFVISKK